MDWPTVAEKHYTNKDGITAIIPSRRARRAEWRSERSKHRKPEVGRLAATDTWRSSWTALRGDL